MTPVANKPSPTEKMLRSEAEITVCFIIGVALPIDLKCGSASNHFGEITVNVYFWLL
jgi:hypothetical protein